MKYIITENRLNDIVIKYLNSEYGDLKPYQTDKYPGDIFFMKDGKVIFNYITDSKNKTYGEVGISYRDVWLFLKNLFGLSYIEAQDITTKWINQTYNLSVDTTTYLDSGKKAIVDKGYNL